MRQSSKRPRLVQSRFAETLTLTLTLNPNPNFGKSGRHPSTNYRIGPTSDRIYNRMKPHSTYTYISDVSTFQLVLKVLERQIFVK